MISALLGDKPEHEDGFESFPTRISGELAQRQAMAARKIQYHHAFLDDVLRGILPHDLILIGAPSGIGKTDLALNIAVNNAMAGRRVNYFALEAEPLELERRTKFSMLSREVYRTHHSRRQEMNYTDWLLGACEEICGPFNRQIDAEILATLHNLRTYYRGAKFDAADLERWILKVHQQSDLLIVDHLHYIDDDSDNEARSLGDTVKTIRDVSLRIGKPIILIAHLRKRDSRGKQIMSTIDDFHGSSNITKICTQAVIIERATSIQGQRWHQSPTFFQVVKDRRGGKPREIAVSMFDLRTKNYANHYTLGRLEGGEWQEIDTNDRPSWARNFKRMETI